MKKRRELTIMFEFWAWMRTEFSFPGLAIYHCAFEFCLWAFGGRETATPSSFQRGRLQACFLFLARKSIDVVRHVENA